MDITNIPQQLIKSLEQKNTEQLAALSRVLNTVLGKTLIATVSNIAPVTPAEREQLLQQTQAALTQLNKLPATNLTPALKAEIARLVQQQELIQSPQLKWVDLVVNHRALLTYSDRPLTNGQQIPVQLQSPQKLVLLDLPAHDIDTTETDMPAAKVPVAVATATELEKPLPTKITNLTNAELVKHAIAELAKHIPQNADPQLIKKLVEAQFTAQNIPEKSTSAAQTPSIADAIKTATQPDNLLPKPSAQPIYSAKELAQKFLTQPKPTEPETNATKALLSENLRNLLPHKDTPNFIFTAVDKLQQLPAPLRARLISPDLGQALKSLAEQIRSPMQLSNPKILQQAINNAGLQFENKLAKINKNLTQSAQQQLDKTTSPQAIFNQDTKGNLLRVLSQTTRELSGQDKPLTSESMLKVLQQIKPLLTSTYSGETEGLEEEPAENLDLFIRQLISKPAHELEGKDLRTQLLTLLQQHSLHSLAKIQLQQMHALNQELENKDSTAPNASWQLEIPVKYQGEMQQLHMRIDREWIDEKKESDSPKGVAKIKQWSVTLRFDLPTLGEFCAQLTIKENNVSATLWAAREKTFAQVAAQIDELRKQLESEGVTVNYLQCMRGIPPEKPMALSYSLIDVST